MRRDLLTKGNWGEVNTKCCEHGSNECGTFFDSVMSSTLTHHGSGRFIHRSTGYFIDKVITSTNCFVDRSLRRQAISSTGSFHRQGHFIDTYTSWIWVVSSTGYFIDRVITSTGLFIDKVITSTNCLVDRSFRQQAISSTGSFYRQCHFINRPFHRQGHFIDSVISSTVSFHRQGHFIDKSLHRQNYFIDRVI